MPEGFKKSRLQALTESSEGADSDESPLLQFPDLDGADYMVNLFREAGIMLSNGMGAVPLSWQEIESWLRTTQRDLSIWEKLTIREMSEGYVSEFTIASKKDAAPPYVPNLNPDNIDRAAVSDKIRNVLGGFKNIKKKPVQ